jgi:hypothetical protein
MDHFGPDRKLTPKVPRPSPRPVQANPEVKSPSLGTSFADQCYGCRGGRTDKTFDFCVAHDGEWLTTRAWFCSKTCYRKKRRNYQPDVADFLKFKEVKQRLEDIREIYGDDFEPTGLFDDGVEWARHQGDVALLEEIRKLEQIEDDAEKDREKMLEAEERRQEKIQRELERQQEKEQRRARDEERDRQREQDREDRRLRDERREQDRLDEQERKRLEEEAEEERWQPRDLEL